MNFGTISSLQPPTSCHSTPDPTRRTPSQVGTGGSRKIFAVLATSEPGRYVRAVVPAAGKFTVYLNTTLTSSAVLSWFILD